MKYEMPNVEFIKFNADDIISTSGSLKESMNGKLGVKVGSMKFTDFFSED